MRAGRGVPVVVFVFSPDVPIKSVHVRQFIDGFRLLCTALHAGAGSDAFARLGGRSGDLTVVPFVRRDSISFFGMRAGRGVPVVVFVFFPNVPIESVHVRQFIDGFRLPITAHRAGVGSDPFGRLGGRGGDDAVIKSVIGFVRHIVMLFGRTGMPVARVVTIPLGGKFMLVFVARGECRQEQHKQECDSRHCEKGLSFHDFSPFVRSYSVFFISNRSFGFAT